MDRAPFVLHPGLLTQRRQTMRLHEIIASNAREASEYLAALVKYPGDLTLTLCDDVRRCMDRIEAAGFVLNPPPETNEYENAHARADERDRIERNRNG